MCGIKRLRCLSTLALRQAVAAASVYLDDASLTSVLDHLGYNVLKWAGVCDSLQIEHD